MHNCGSMDPSKVQHSEEGRVGGGAVLAEVEAHARGRAEEEDNASC
jgi:hypothetical protein